MDLFSSPSDVREIVQSWRPNARIALVPTMGALHEGHLSLVRLAKHYADKIVVSIFVNPLQFGAGEDLDKYPRQLEADKEALQALDVDLLFAPTPTDLYPDGFNTSVSVGELGGHLCGASRPGHFQGVTTVCLKLFQISQADFAVFGEKDFQQLRILEKMVEDLNLPISIVRHETVREEDGLAMSSRNQNLSPRERQVAGRIPQALQSLKAFLGSSTKELKVDDVLSQVRTNLGNSELQIDYVAVAPEHNLTPSSQQEPLHKIPSPHLFLAVKIGQTRLIDNVALHGDI